MKHTDTPRISRGSKETALAYIGITGVIASAALFFFAPAPGRAVFFPNAAAVYPASFLAFSIVCAYGIFRMARALKIERDIAHIMRESKERLARAVSLSHEGLWDWSEEEKSVFFSERWHEMHSLPPETISTVSDWEGRIHADDIMSVRSAITEHIEGQRRIYGVEYRIRNGNGNYVWLSDRGAYDPMSKRMSGFSRDISSQKHVEEALQSRTEELARAKEATIPRQTRRFLQAPKVFRPAFRDLLSPPP